MQIEKLIDDLLKGDDFPFIDELVFNPFENHINSRVLRPTLDYLIETKGSWIDEAVPKAINQILTRKGDKYVQEAVKKRELKPTDLHRDDLWVSYEVYQTFLWIAESISNEDNLFENVNLRAFQKENKLTTLLKGEVTPEMVYRYQVPRFTNDFNYTIDLKVKKVEPGFASYTADVAEKFKGHGNKDNPERSLRNYKRGQDIIIGRLRAIPTLFGKEPARYKIVSSIVKGDKISEFEFYFKPSPAINRILKPLIFLLRGNKILKEQLNDLEKAHGREIEDKDRIQTLYEQLQDTHSELVRTQEEMVQARTFAGVGEMTSQIVHDARNYNTGISGYAQLIKMHLKGEENTKIRDMCDLIIKKVSEEQEMFEDTLRFVRGKKLQPKIERKNIEDYIRRACTEINYVVGEKINITTDLEYKGDIYIDEQKMTRIITNLSKNAAEAMPDGGNITIKTSSDDSYIHIWISDTGTGIPEEIHPKIFEKLNTYGKKEGTGLGLSIAKRFVEAHDGTIEVESYTKEMIEKKKMYDKSPGTTFKIKIPKKE